MLQIEEQSLIESLPWRFFSSFFISLNKLWQGFNILLATISQRPIFVSFPSSNTKVLLRVIRVYKKIYNSVHHIPKPKTVPITSWTVPLNLTKLPSTSRSKFYIHTGIDLRTSRNPVKPTSP